MSSITHVLPGFPQVNQNHEPTADGQPDENHDWNCVPASLAAGLMYLTGKPFDGDQLHDAVYGNGYRGGQAASAYVAYCKAQGVALTRYVSDPAGLVKCIHREVGNGHPVVLTMPSLWGIPRSQQKPGFTTHVGIAYGVGPTAIRVMNPWIDNPQDGEDAYWAAELCNNEVWILTKAGEAPVSTNSVSVPAGWHDDGTVLTAPNKVAVVLGFREYILQHPWFSGDVPLAAERGVTGGQQQDFRYSILHHDNTTKAITEHDRLDILENELAQEQHSATALSTEVDDLHTQLSSAQSTIASQEQQIATLKQQPPTPTPAQQSLTVAEATAALVVAIATELTISSTTTVK